MDLTKREIEILYYLESDLSVREISNALFVSKNTMKSHVRHIFKKLDVHSRSAAVSKWRQVDE